MHIDDLVPVFDPAELASVESVPITGCRFIDVAIRTAAGIEGHFVCAGCVTNQWRTVARRHHRTSGVHRGVGMPPGVLITAICIQIEMTVTMILNTAHNSGFAQRAHISTYWIQGDVRQSRSAIAPDALSSKAFKRYVQFCFHHWQKGGETKTIALAGICMPVRSCR